MAWSAGRLVGSGRQSTRPGPRFALTSRAMAERWILRKGSKRRGFRYVTSAGAPVTASGTLARIEALRIPPAWTDVHIAPSPSANVQAWGFDAKGRKQYR